MPITITDEQKADILQLLGRLDGKVDVLMKAVLGDGQPGLVQKVEDLEASRNRMWGAGAVITFLGGILEWLYHRH